jgi:hypothetical protein
MITNIPDYIIELSKQMNESPNRCTAHPFWQVRTYEYLPTDSERNVDHWVLCDDEGVFFESNKNDYRDLAKVVKDRYPEYFSSVVEEYRSIHGKFKEVLDVDDFASAFDIEYEELPLEVDRVFMQKVETVVWTGLTEAAANQFIKRKSHDYPSGLFTYVESAYWSPQFADLIEWIKALSDMRGIN